MLASAPSIVVNVSSVMHHLGSTDFRWHSTGFSWRSYSTSKLCNLLHSAALNKRFRSRGLCSCAVSPGSVDSDIWREWTTCTAVFKWVRDVFFLSPSEGAEPTVQRALAAVGERAENALPLYSTPYWQPWAACWVPFEFISKYVGCTASKPSAAALDEGLQEDLWVFSEQLVSQIVHD
jgi:NAD(P)-dependent dehydrogenase (short-subunit alcohol dehydrogenase family)